MRNMIYEQDKILPRRVHVLYEFCLGRDAIGYMLRQEQKRKASLKWQKIYD
jgi:hypothetical protein